MIIATYDNKTEKPEYLILINVCNFDILINLEPQLELLKSGLSLAAKNHFQNANFDINLKKLLKYVYNQRKE